MAECPCVSGPPCRQSCTCANEALSGGCDRCNRYGQPDRPELLTISVGELAEGLHSLVCHCPRGTRCGRMDFHREQAAEAFADIQRQRDTLKKAYDCDECQDTGRKLTGGRCLCPAWDGYDHRLRQRDTLRNSGGLDIMRSATE